MTEAKTSIIEAAKDAPVKLQERLRELADRYEDWKPYAHAEIEKEAADALDAAEARISTLSTERDGALEEAAVHIDKIADEYRARAWKSESQSEQKNLLLMASEFFVRAKEIRALKSSPPVVAEDVVTKTLLWAAWIELNTIRARDGAPSGVSEPYFDRLVIEISNHLAPDNKPWPSDTMRPVVDNLLRTDKEPV